MRRRTAATLGLVLALGLTACGGGGGKSTAKQASDQDAMRKFAQCMRANGVDMPDPSSDGKFQIKGKKGDGGMDKMKSAEAKCRHLMPNGGKPQKLKPEDLAKQRAMAKCMREHGITEFPDPQPDGGIRIEARKGSKLDPESKTFQDADKACNKDKARRGGMTREDGGTDGDPGLFGRSAN